jgi:Beta-propeller repeat
MDPLAGYTYRWLVNNTRRVQQMKKWLSGIMLILQLAWASFAAAAPAPRSYQEVEQAASPAPPAYSWHAFFGVDTGQDSGFNVATDPAGNIYLVGEATETWSGPGGIPPLHAPSGSLDVVIMKLDPHGSYQWHTFYGASDGDEAKGIAVDLDGNVYVTGFSIVAWSGPQGETPLHGFDNTWNMFVLKLDTQGAYQWHTFYGYDGTNMGCGIALDGLGGVYAAGQSYTAWLGDGGAAPLHAFTPGSYEITVLKLDTDGAYQWHTFYGSDGIDAAWEVVTDASGNIYLAGSSSGSWNGDGNTPPLHGFAENMDMVVMKLTASGAYAWHTFWGGAGWDDALDLDLDSDGNIYVTGAGGTFLGNGDTAPLHAFSGGDSDIIVTKLSPLGGYLWHTFYGAPQGTLPWEDAGHGIAVADDGLVAVVGHAVNAWNGDGGAPPKTPHNGFLDIFILALDRNGLYQQHRFYGQTDGYTNYRPERDIVADAQGNIITAGVSIDNWLGDGNRPPLNAHSDAYNRDIEVIKLGRITDQLYLPQVSK